MPFELDPDMFAEPLPGYADTGSPRVAAGLGTIARVVAGGEDIYPEKLPIAEAMHRIETCYRPYHDALAGLVAETRARFGACLVVDCHSMPSVGSVIDRDPGRARVDMVLGDRHGTSCADAVIDATEQALTSQGFAVTRNTPYAGGYTTRHLRPARRGGARPSDRGQPGSLHGPAGGFARPPTCPSWPAAWAA